MGGPLPALSMVPSCVGDDVKLPKPRVQYGIYKKLGRRFDYWDGPFTSYKHALRMFERSYRNADAPQDFFLLKEVLTVVHPKVKKAKSK